MRTECGFRKAEVNGIPDFGFRISEFGFASQGCNIDAGRVSGRV